MRVRCPSCSAKLNAKPQLAGERVPCPKCGKPVLVPELEDLEEDEENEESSSGRSRKLVYLQKNEASGTDIPGTISLVLSIFALASLAMGWFTHGWTYYAAAAIALVGFGLGFLGHGRLRIADCTLNFLILLPAVVVSALLLAGMPVVKKGPASAANGSAADVGPPVEVARVEDAGSAQPAPRPKWLNAGLGEQVKVGKVLVKIGDVRVAAPKSDEISKLVESMAGGAAAAEQPTLLVEVLVGNPSDTIKMEMTPWSKAHGSEAPRLTDNFKNNYRPPTSTPDLLGMLAKQTATQSIRPESTFVDTLVFEEPGAKVQYLLLELPTENIGGKGLIYFQIPRSMIQGMR